MSSRSRSSAARASRWPTGTSACRCASRRGSGSRSTTTPTRTSPRRGSFRSATDGRDAAGMSATAPDWVRYFAERYPDRIALTDADTDTDTLWTELEERVARLAGGLLDDV